MRIAKPTSSQNVPKKQGASATTVTRARCYLAGPMLLVLANKLWPVIGACVSKAKRWIAKESSLEASEHQICNVHNEA